MTHHVNAPARRHGGLLGSHAAEVVHFDNLSQPAILARKSLQRIVQFQHLQLPAAAVRLYLNVGVPWYPAPAAAALGSAQSTRVVDQYLPHDTRHHRQEVSAVGELGRRFVEEPYVGFVDQSRWLESMTGPLAAKKRLRDPAQFAIDQMHQLVECGMFSVAQPSQEDRDLRRHRIGAVHYIMILPSRIAATIEAVMDKDAITLFHELADRSPAEREDYYAQRQVPEAVRAEVESLLRFDVPAGPSLGAYLASAAEEVLLEGDGVPETIAHYRITTMLGEGGMGKVYRATDTKLGREVAIKVIPAAFAQDAGRMARFTREAKVLASLNHPNIAAIYGVEDRALVMELVEGPTLAERMARGAVPLPEALEIARQMADALEAAHEKGIVHRDLKPANVKVNPDGIVKVLDFGLAMAQAPAGDSSSPENSPTLTIRHTEAGIILGTAAYMSPEQARGKAVDKRADIWAFGVVLYEMLTGRRLFDGETVPDILVAVLNTEPEWNQVAGKVQRLLRACLEKDPKRRLQAIGDARLLLEDSLEIPAPRAKSWLAWAGVAAICTVLAALAVIGWLRPQTGGGTAPNLAFTIVPPQE